MELNLVAKLMDNVNRYYELQLCYAELCSLGAKNVSFDLLNDSFTFEASQEVCDSILYRSSWLKSLNGTPTLLAQMIEECREVVWEYSGLWFPHLSYPFKARMRPQTARSLINITCPKGGWVLDPFLGSGTTSVEAFLLGVNSVGIDIVPFYVFMSEAKIRFFDTKISPLFNKHPLQTVILVATTMLKTKSSYGKRLGEMVELQQAFEKFKEKIKPSTHVFHNGTATEIPYPDNFFDGVVTSPPYGSAIDYLKENPGPRDLMEIPGKLKPFLVLTKDEQNWKNLMEKAIQETHRVLKPGGKLAIIIGNQKRKGKEVDLVGWMKNTLTNLGFRKHFEFTELISSTGTRNILTDKVLTYKKL